MARLALVGIFLMLAASAGCQCCQPACNRYADLIDDIGELSPISRPWCDDERECRCESCTRRY